MKAYYKVVMLLAITCIACSMAYAQVVVGGPLTSNTIWSPDQNPYIVAQDVTVPVGITLTIMPGVILRFQEKMSIIVYGTLIAQGTDTSKIHFTSDSPGFSWSGLKLYKTHTQLDGEGNYHSGTIISDALIENASYSISLEDSSSILIEECEISNSNSWGIYLRNSSNNIIRNCTISNSNFGIFIPTNNRSSFNLFTGNYIHDNLNVGLFMNNNSGSAKYNVIDGNHFSNNQIGLYLGNEGPEDIAHNIVRNNIFSDNPVNGLRIYQDSTTISGNIFNNNGSGISFFGSKNSRIKNNMIFSNHEWGVMFSGDAGYNILESNNIFDNHGGILLTGQDGDSSHNNSILRNAIHHNDGIAILIEAAPQAGIQFNNIYNNSAEKCFINQTLHLIHAEYNWWGTTDTLLINQQIFDVFDNQNSGFVKYKPYSGAPISTPPISSPRNVVKRPAGDHVELSWAANQENDLGGYRVYFNYISPYAFADYVDVDNTTQFSLNGISIFDTIAVTAYDSQADGNSDQLEGHESEFSYAMIGPSAGADTSICNGKTFTANSAFAYNYSSLHWSTSGDGSFTDTSALHTNYTPGTEDKTSGMVTLSLSIINDSIEMTDGIQLMILSAPLAQAGSDAAILQDSSFHITESHALYSDSIRWTTSGDGQFSNENSIHPTYSPGNIDINTGQVALTLNTISSCGSGSDALILHILPTFSISGMVHAGNMPMYSGTLLLLLKSGKQFEPLRSGQIQNDGKFHIRTLLSDSLLIYVSPNPVEYTDYLPTYYVGELNWENAYILPVGENIYDLDIYMRPRYNSLPTGVGSISGTIIPGGGNNMAPQTDVQNLTILLFDGKGTNVLGYATCAEDGTFIFPKLPYGDYYLRAEKAGYESENSALIKLTVSNPEITGVLISLFIQKHTLSIQLQEDNGLTELKTFPNPASDILHVVSPMTERISGYSIIDATGRIMTSLSDNLGAGKANNLEIGITNLAKGYYTLIIYYEPTALHCSFLKQ
jgi:parallel beta-helix repeat protein